MGRRRISSRYWRDAVSWELSQLGENRLKGLPVFWIIDYYICAVFCTWEPNANFHKVEEESRSYLSLCYLPHFSIFKMSFLPVLLSENPAETSGRRADNAYGGLKCGNSKWEEQKKKKENFCPFILFFIYSAEYVNYWWWWQQRVTNFTDILNNLLCTQKQWGVYLFILLNVTHVQASKVKNKQTKKTPPHAHTHTK